MTVGKVCEGVLNTYIKNPWEWLRESDLVADLVQLMRQSLANQKQPLYVSAKIEYDSPSITTSHSPEILRVRTEVKFEKDGDNNNKNDPCRADICLLKPKEEKAALHILNQGIRDVNLRINPGDVEELLEVKLAPHHYLKDGQTLWLNDLIKLSKLGNKYPSLNAPKHLLSIDTGLPIQSLFDPPTLANATPLTYEKGPIPNGLKRYWPLVAKHTYCFSQQSDVNGKIDFVKITPIPCNGDAGQTRGVYFWALALDLDETAKEISLDVPNNSKALGELLKNNFIKNQYMSISGVIPACWEVEVKEVDKDK